MSAFVLSRRQLSDLATGINNAISKHNEFPYIDREALLHVFNGNLTCDAFYKNIYKELLRINTKSYNARYGVNPDDSDRIAELDSPTSDKTETSRAQFIINLKCWLYQSCEFEGYEKNPVYRVVNNLYQDVVKQTIEDYLEEHNSKWAY